MEPDGLTVGAAGTSLGSAARSSLLLLLQNPHGGHMPLYLQPPPNPRYIQVANGRWWWWGGGRASLLAT